jgi:hypothetical protein
VGSGDVYCRVAVREGGEGGGGSGRFLLFQRVIIAFSVVRMFGWCSVYGVMIVFST